MPNVVRLSDICMGHGCFPPRPNTDASPDVLVNGMPVHRQGDQWTTHCCDDTCHDGVLAAGSPTVFVNGKQIARAGDPISCGSLAGGTHSPDVIAGE